MTVTALICTSALVAAAPSHRSDIASIRTLEQRQEVAWNAHDIGAYAQLFTRDSQVVNVLGWHWRSRAELQQKLGRGFTSIFAHSTIRFDEPIIDFLKPDIAVVHVRWTMSGALSPGGPSSQAPEAGIQTQVLVKRAGAWKIADFQNTNSIPERPFPSSPK